MSAAAAAAAASFSIPLLTTERLALRETRVADFDTYAAFMANEEQMKFMGSKTVDRRTAWRFFGGFSGSWALTGAGWWAVENRATGEFVGTVGAFFRETSLETNGVGVGMGSALVAEPDLELGWTIFQPFWRRGYAKEAAKAALDHGLHAHTNVKRAIAIIDPANAASIAVSKAIGMTLDGDHDFYGEPSVRYAIGRPART